MIAEPKCSVRKCKHFMGVKQEDGSEDTEKIICAAFPEGIPFSIAYGPNRHITPLPNQGNDIVFQKKGR